MRVESIFLFLACLPACADTTDPVSKGRARALGGVDSSGADLCFALGWYGDGVCDDFCVEPDPDCATCPDPTDTRVTYASTDPATCRLVDLSCVLTGSREFSNECGCGCIDQETSCRASDEVDYWSNEPGFCATVDDACPAGWSRFEDDCGCGCEQNACPDATDPNVRYASTSPEECKLIDLGCFFLDGSASFSNECGCGCIRPDTCQEPSSADVDYWSTEPGFCATVDAACTADWEPFVDACGCGCVRAR